MLIIFLFLYLLHVYEKFVYLELLHILMNNYYIHFKEE